MSRKLRIKVVGQSKVDRLIESVVNTGAGMILAFSVMQWILVPLLSIDDYTWQKNLIVTPALTLLSIGRGYVIRSFFNWWMILKAQGKQLWDEIKRKMERHMTSEAMTLISLGYNYSITYIQTRRLLWDKKLKALKKRLRSLF